jgi:hypothetical protein
VQKFVYFSIFSPEIRPKIEKIGYFSGKYRKSKKGGRRKRKLSTELAKGGK